jgi:hypothetical protein
MRRRPVTGLAGLLILAACDGATPLPATPTAPAASANAAPAISGGLTWSTQVGGAGMALILSGPNGEPLLRLACVRDPAAMTVTAERFTAIGSEERLTLGVGEEAFTFVADATAERPIGVEGTAPISEDLLAGLPTANAVSAVYGQQRTGPHTPPDADATRRFVDACRSIATS